MKRSFFLQMQNLAGAKRKFILSIFLLILFILSLTCGSRAFYDRLAQEDVLTDFVAYWSSARLLLLSDNPYCSEHLQILQQSVGWSQPDPLVMYNPPSTLTYILPFTAGNYVTSKFLWLVFILGLTLWSAQCLWYLYGGAKEKRHWLLILLATFSPVYFMLGKGQIIPIVLIGLVGFLYFQEKRNDLLAGISITTLITIKPHVAYLFCIILLLWLTRERRWHILTGAFIGNFMFFFVPLFFNQNLLTQYWEAMLNQRGAYLWATPTIGTYLRFFWGGDKYWLQYLPMLFGISWLFLHWLRRRSSWNWTQEMPMLLVISLMTNFYCWVNDYALMIATTIHPVTLIAGNRINKISLFLIGFYIFMNFIAFITYYNLNLSEHYFIWYPLFILVFHSIAAKNFAFSSTRIR